MPAFINLADSTRVRWTMNERVTFLEGDQQQSPQFCVFTSFMLLNDVRDDLIGQQFLDTSSRDEFEVHCKHRCGRGLFMTVYESLAS